MKLLKSCWNKNWPGFRKKSLDIFNQGTFFELLNKWYSVSGDWTNPKKSFLWLIIFTFIAKKCFLVLKKYQEKNYFFNSRSDFLLPSNILSTKVNKFLIHVTKPNFIVLYWKNLVTEIIEYSFIYYRVSLCRILLSSESSDNIEYFQFLCDTNISDQQ